MRQMNRRQRLGGWFFCWIRMLLLLTHCISFTRSISFCSTPIILSAGQTIPFHVEEEGDLLTAAQHFCSRNYIGESDCQRIVDFHREKCFAKSDRQQNEGVSEDGEGIDEVESGKESKIRKISSVQGSSFPSTNEIDYSQRVGPILPVTHKGLTHNLQTYQGETPEGAIKRFCGMLKLNAIECQQVHDPFLKLIDAKSAIDSDTPDSQSVEKDQKDHQSADHSSQSTDPSLPSFWARIYSQLTDLLNQYWNYIILFVTVMYVILENPIQL
jgi:hypothetical protein